MNLKRFAFMLGLLCLVTGMAWIAATSARIPSTATSLATELAPSGSETASLGPAQVRVAAAERRTLNLLTTASGKLEAWRQLEVRSEVAGEVVEAPEKEGVLVARGGPIVGLRDDELKLRVAQAEAEWLRRQASFSVNFALMGSGAKGAETSVQRPDRTSEAELRQRLDAGLISQERFAEEQRRLMAESFLSGERRLEVQSAVSGVTQAQHELSLSRMLLAKARIQAPFAGRVADLKVTPGQIVEKGQLLLTLLDDSRMRAEVEVLEADLVRLRVGSAAKVVVPALGRTFAGRIHSINPRIEPEFGMGRVVVEVANPLSTLICGLYATVELESRRLENQVVIPESALLVRQGREVVFRVRSGIAEWTYVTVEERSGTEAAVSGLESGDLVVVDGHQSLAHGVPVEVASDSPDSTPGG